MPRVWTPAKRLSFLLVSLFVFSFFPIALQPAPAAQAQTAPYITVSQDSGPTGTFLTIYGYNQPKDFSYGDIKIFLPNPAVGQPTFLIFGQASYGREGRFEWHGPLPRAGDWFGGYNRETKGYVVPKGRIKIGFGLFNGFSGGETEFTVTDNSTGPYVNSPADSTYAMDLNWQRTDRLVAQGNVSRSYIWGPGFITTVEPYKEAPNGWRVVRYYDKSRMEVSNPALPSENNPYYVTNGLLVQEMVSGKLQLGDGTFRQVEAANVPAAGDLNTTNKSPNFAIYSGLLQRNDYKNGDTITFVFDFNGRITKNNALTSYNVTAGNFVKETGHYIASPFWQYLNSTGAVLDDNYNQRTGRIFDPLFYATGLPITDAYWTRTTVNGVEKDVLVQLFERRVLTYTPTNSAAFQVEMGNVGLQYYIWRYSQPS